MSDGWFTRFENGLDIPFSYPSLVLALAAPYALVYSFYLKTPTQVSDLNATILVLTLLLLYKPVIYSITARLTHKQESETAYILDPLQETLPYTVFTFLITTAIITVGFLCFFFPGVYLSKKLAYTVPASAIYGDRPLQSLSSSYTQTRDNSRAIYRLLALTTVFTVCFVIAIAATGMLGITFYMLGAFFGVLTLILASIVELGIISAFSSLAIEVRE